MSASKTNNYVHRFIPADEVSAAPTLLVLHGTGGDENDLVGIGQAMLPNANILSPRGNVPENGMPRFFRRLAEGVFDVEDVKRRAHELADFVSGAATQYMFDPARVFTAGYSNGANIAAAVLLLRPGALAGAALLRPMVPLVPDPLPKLPGTPILICGGEFDPIASPSQTAALSDVFEQCGASVRAVAFPVSHGLTQSDVETAHDWFERVVPRR